MKRLTQKLLAVADRLLAPLVYPAAWLLKRVRRVGVQKLPRCRQALLQVGVFPIRDHYYEPQFDHRSTTVDFSEPRELPGIEWNDAGQLEFLQRLTFAEELAAIKSEPTEGLTFHFNNGQFESGDAEYWYQFVRATKPKRLIEVGSGNSTLLAIKALKQNRAEDPNYACEHLCVEPYEMPWLESAGVEVIRKKVEAIDPGFFSQLQDNDILFIDSSHIIRPHGDVLYEYLELLPTLNRGVYVHVHDIFSPRNYLSEWLVDDVRFWNEQYLLEAFLSHNRDWRIVGALNYLHHCHYERLRAVAPYLERAREPGSFYLQKLA